MKTKLVIVCCALGLLAIGNIFPQTEPLTDEQYWARNMDTLAFVRVAIQYNDAMSVLLDKPHGWNSDRVTPDEEMTMYEAMYTMSQIYMFLPEHIQRHAALTYNMAMEEQRSDTAEDGNPILRLPETIGTTTRGPK